MIHLEADPVNLLGLSTLIPRHVCTFSLGSPPLRDAFVTKSGLLYSRLLYRVFERISRR